MDEMRLEHIKTRMISLTQGNTIRRIKIWYIVFLVVGFFLLLFIDRETVKESDCLNLSALILVRDTTIDYQSFLTYIMPAKIGILLMGILFWWWGYGTLYCYMLLTMIASSMGALAYICLLRYQLKGILLWSILHLPHSMCYLLTITCGILLSDTMRKTKRDNINFVFRNTMLTLTLILTYAIGIYMQAYVQVNILKKLLSFF